VFALGRGVQGIGIEICDEFGFFRGVEMIVGAGIPLGNGGHPTAHAVFDHEVCLEICYEIQFCICVF